MKRFHTLCAATSILALSSTLYAGPKDGMKEGAPDLKSIGALAFGPEGILFAADAKGAAVFAIALKDEGSKPKKIEGLNQKIAATLGTKVDNIKIEDLAIHPKSGSTYLSVSRGRGPEAKPALVQLTEAGVSVVAMDKVLFSKATLENAPEDKVVGEGRRRQNKRTSSITDMAWADGKVAVAGLSNEEFASTLRVLDFPFTGEAASSSVEIYHGAHGKFETHSPIRTLLPVELEGETNIIASYTCTPLVRIPVKKIKPKAHIKGDTIAELGNRNRPLDMIEYEKDGKHFLLVANSARGIMKIEKDALKTDELITTRARDKAGVDYDTIEGWDNVTQLSKLDGKHAAIIKEWRDDDDKAHAEFDAVALP